MDPVPEDANAGKGRILVVDDDTGVREMILRVLRRRGYQAQGAVDGLQALARLQHGDFDAVVTDLQMPRLNGLALVREVHRMEALLPVVVHTAVVDPSLKALLYKAGAFRVLMKGGPVEDLLRSVEEACQASHDTRACWDSGSGSR